MNSTLVIGTVILTFFTLNISAQTKDLTESTNQMSRDGHVILLPEQGIVYIVSDLHAHWNDFNQWLEQTRLIERIEAGEDVYGVMLGDSIDYKPTERPKPPYGDIQIVNRVIELQQQLGEKGKRLIYIRGNHEYAAAEAYAMLKSAGMTELNRPAYIRKLYNGPTGSYYRQFNFIERMNDTHYDFLINLPTVVVGKNGFVAVHAGPARSIGSLSDLVKPSQKTLDAILWDRPKITRIGGYTFEHTKNFLKAINGRFLIVGHTPISYFPPETIRDSVARLDGKQLIFSTGYGGLRGGQTYIEIDLSKTYTSVDELTSGVNIHRLYPK